ncbi:uncharacterized protein LOC117182540 [Belonocnema kinseyi]|uniref:uncharacterized protein LOC117182540 n=1 Tax=Belonocnema kinseyi TaxID=2817044 RepID=UPI00143D9EBF|nr:uncharacterized protein LOC117182540 [Belonocnema kinseyi]
MKRGVKLEQFIVQNDLHVLNDPCQPLTFQSVNGQSWIDVTLATSNILPLVESWNVRVDWTSSDHRVIDFGIRFRKAPSTSVSSSGRFPVKKMDVNAYEVSFKELAEEKLAGLPVERKEDVEAMADTITECIVKACETSTPVHKLFKRSHPWWNRKLTFLKRQLHMLRRRRQKKQAKTGKSYPELVAFRGVLRLYRKSIRDAKRGSIRKFITKIGNEEPWGYVYQLQTERLRTETVLSTIRTASGHTCTLEETASEYFRTLVPDDDPSTETQEQVSVREFAATAPDTEEVYKILKTLKNNKAPGPDRIEVMALKKAWPIIGPHLVRHFNDCRKFSVFPKT